MPSVYEIITERIIKQLQAELGALRAGTGETGVNQLILDC